MPVRSRELRAESRGQRAQGQSRGSWERRREEEEPTRVYQMETDGPVQGLNTLTRLHAHGEEHAQQSVHENSSLLCRESRVSFSPFGREKYVLHAVRSMRT